MTTRGSYTLTYDAENRLTAVSGPATASFVYDADPLRYAAGLRGGRVKATFGATTTIYVGNHYEKTGNAIKKYYYAGGRRIAMRTGGQTYYLFPDHLGGTHIRASSVNGAELGKLL